jgi:hypothetical protein
MNDMKVRCRVYKGIEYIRVADLPEEQQKKFLQTVDYELFIKILIDKKIISDCIQYKDYENWFDRVYNPVTQTKVREEVNQAVIVQRF